MTEDNLTDEERREMISEIMAGYPEGSNYIVDRDGGLWVGPPYDPANDWRCHDCGMNTTPHDAEGNRLAGWEVYSVHDEVWEAAGGERSQGWVLCIGCLEGRLGRRLVHGDFNMAVRVNEPGERDSDRLTDRREHAR